MQDLYNPLYRPNPYLNPQYIDTSAPVPAQLQAPDPSSIGMFEGFDYLVNKYPRFKDAIFQLRAKGFDDDIIERTFAERIEPRLPFVIKPSEVNAWLGRTEQSMQLTRDYEYYKRHQLYKDATGKSDDEIFTAEGLSQRFGISTSTLLSNPELTKKLTEGLKVRESWWGSAYRGANNFFITRKLANLWERAARGTISEEEAQRQTQELNKYFIPEPLVPTTMNSALAGASGILAQGLNTTAMSWLTGKTTGLIGGAVGGIAGMMAGGPAGAVAGATTGFSKGYAIGTWLMAARELWTLGAGLSYYNSSGIRDKNGQPLDENSRRVAAAAEGLGVVAIEMLTFPKMAANIPLARKVFGLGELPPIDMSSPHPIINYLVKEFGREKLEGVWWGAVNNTAETILGETAPSLAKWLSGQPFVAIAPDWSELGRSAAETFTTSVRDFGLNALMTLPFGMYGLNKAIREFNTSLRDSARVMAQQTGMTQTEAETLLEQQVALGMQKAHDDYNAKLAGMEQQATQVAHETTAAQETQTQPPEQSAHQVTEQPATPSAAPDTQETSLPVTQEQPAEITPPQETTPAAPETSQEQQTQTEQPQTDKPSYYFIPRADFEQYYLPKHPEATSMQVIYTDNEVGLTAEQFEQITTEDPGFHDIIGNDIRQDADGTTLTEAIEKIQNTDPAEAEAFHSPENQQAMQQFAQRLVDAGTPQQEAQDIAAIVGALSASFIAQEGVPPIQIDVTTSEQLEAQRSDMSRLNPDYDINNPLTWTDQNRAQRLLAAGERSGLSTTDKLLKGFIEKLIGKGEKSLDTEQENLTPEQLAERTTMERELREEAADYTRTLTTANQDAVDTLRTRTDLDTDRYEVGGKFPHGKNRNPDATYTHEDFSGVTKIDFATRKNDLVIKVKNPKNKSPLILTVKNFRDANFSDVVQDLTQGETFHGVQVSETPVGMYLVNALTDFWTKQGLPKVAVQSVEMAQPIDVHTEDLSVERPQVHTEDLSVEHPQVHALDLSTPERVPVQGERIERPQIQVHSDNADFHSDGYPEVHGGRIERPQIQVHSLSPEQIQELDRTIMPEQARHELAQDEAAWRQTVDRVIADKNITTRSQKFVDVMRYTPQVFTLLGANQLPILIREGKILKILKDHKGMTSDALKGILSHIVDPVAIFRGTEGEHESLAILTETTDETGGSVLAAFHLDVEKNPRAKTKAYINKVASTYAKEKNGKARYTWFEDQLNDGTLLYIDPVRAKHWTDRTGAKLLPDSAVIKTDNGKTEISIDGRQIKTRDDLINLWQQHKQEGLYKTDPETGENLAQTMFRFGRSVIEVMGATGKNTNYAVFAHEIGHTMFYMMDKLARDGSIQMQQDMQVMLDHAGVTREAWDADINGARKKAHEWFANAFEVYLSEGRAPNKKLQGVFTRIKNYLLKFYHNITQQLGVELDDEVRAVFDRLLSMPDETSSVEQLAQIDTQIDTQVAGYETNIRQELQALAQEAQSRNTARVRTIAGTEVDVRYRVVDAGELITSTTETGAPNPAFPQEFQPRQRDRESSFSQIDRIANNIDPELLAEDRLASAGAPVIGPDMMVESGNGRAMALRQAYARGKAEGYRKWLSDNLTRFGLSPKDIEGVANPVLVRERTSDVDRLAFVVEANESNIAAMSPVEHAQEDARRITPAMLQNYDTTRSLAGNTDFLREFINLVPQNERGELLQAGGSISRAGLERALNALIAVAYKDNSILKRLGELFDDDIQNVSNALVQAASRIAIFETSARRVDLSLQNDITQAVNVLVNLKEQGFSVGEYLSQPSLFGDDISQGAKMLLEFFDNNKRSAARMAEGLRLYAEFASQEAVEGQVSMFEETIHSKEELLQSALERAEFDTNPQADYDPKRRLATEGKGKTTFTQLEELRKKWKKEKDKAVSKGKAEAVEKTKARFQERIDNLKAKHREQRTSWEETRRQQRQDITHLQRQESKHQKVISRLQKRINNLREWQEKRSQKRDVQRMVKGIFRMSKSKGIKVERLLEIKELLEQYNLSRKGHQKRDLIRSFLDMENVNDPALAPEAEAMQETSAQSLEDAGITQQDIEDFLDKIHIEDMTPTDIKYLYEQVKAIHEQGKAEFAKWQAENQARMLELRAPLVDTIIKNTKDPEKRTITDRNDLVRKYVLGPIGDMMQTYWDAVMTPGRFLQYVLGDGFREVFGDGFTERRGEADRHIHERTTAVQEQLKQLGFHIQDFLEKAITVDGQDYTWTQVQAIYLGMQNPHHREAIIWGNFVNNALNQNKKYATEEQGMNAINQILAFINSPENERYRLAAELVKNDFDANFDRLRETQIRDFNRDLNREENYSPMYRLAHVTAQGLIDEEAENLARTGDHSALMQKVTDNFTISRKNLGRDKQAPVSLDLWNNWKRAVQEQEYQINLGRYAADVMSALFSVGEQGTLADLIKKRVGQPAWDTLRSIFNDSIHDHNVLESDAASKVAQWLIAARSFAYVGYNPITAITQTASLLAGIRDASAKNLFKAVWKGKNHLFRSIFKALHMADTGQADAFMESVFEKCPELRFTGGDPETRALQQRTYEDASEYGHNVTRALARGTRTIQRHAYDGVMFFDQLTKCMVFDAAYQTAIEKGMTEQEAIAYGRGAVQDTQPASHVSEQSRFTKSYGVRKLFFSQFMNALVPIFNMSVVDVVYNLKAKNWNAVKAAGWALTGGVLSVLAAAFIKDLANGKLPSGEELDSGETDSWEKWLYDSTIEGLLNTFPLFNFFLVNAFRGARGNKTYRAENRWFEPLQTLGRGFFGTQSNTDEDFTGWNLDNIIKGASLLGAPIPYSAGKRLLKFFVGSEEE